MCFLQTVPELYDLVTKYEPEIIWSDGDNAADSTYWKAEEFLAWYATNSTVNQTAVWNDRWGKDALVRGTREIEGLCLYTVFSSHRLGGLHHECVKNLSTHKALVV